MILRHTEVRVAARATLRAGFTLMEVLVVAAIIVILAGVGGVVYTNYLEKAKEDTAYLMVKTLSEQVELYKVNYGDYPPSLEVFTQPIENKPAVLEASQLFDPWGRPYQYERENRHQLTGKPRVYSTGADGSKIIANWN
jgi:general secretion pathway protein G